MPRRTNGPAMPEMVLTGELHAANAPDPHEDCVDRVARLVAGRWIEYELAGPRPARPTRTGWRNMRERNRIGMMREGVVDRDVPA